MKNFIIRYFVAHVLFLLCINSAVAAVPNNINPVDGATGVSTTPVLEISCLTDDLSAQYQISDDASFATIIHDSGESPNDICSHVAIGALKKGVSYYWRARTKDNSSLWSDWSQATALTTINATQKTGLIEFRDGVAVYSGTRDADIRGSFVDPLSAIREWIKGLIRI